MKMKNLQEYIEFFSNGDIKEEKYYFQGKEIEEEKI